MPGLSGPPLCWHDVNDINLTKMKKILVLLFAFIQMPQLSMAEADSFKLVDWELVNSSLVNESDENVSSVSYSPEGWYEVKVPTTVLNALVEHGVYPDPRVGMNNFLIPDASDEFNERNDLAKYSYLPDGRNPWTDPYWYRTVFRVPSALQKGKKVWLDFNGINYRAEVWINGVKIADRGEMSGMFRRFRYDITEHVSKGDNCVAVKVWLPDHPGTPSSGAQFALFGPHRGHSTDIFMDETLKFSGGWDCAPVVRDRNMGIWQDVRIEVTDYVTIKDPYVVTTLPGNNDLHAKKDLSKAYLDIEATLTNHSDKDVKGRLHAKISLVDKLEFPTYSRELEGTMKPVEVSLPVELKAGESKCVKLSPAEFSALTINDPYLWWPNGYGEQYLHDLSLEFRTGGRVSDTEEVTFGMREVSTELHEKDGEYGHVFRINGKRVFCKGGWFQPDMLLNDPVKRIYDQARLLSEANVTLIGSEDLPSPSEDWLDSWNKYGLMDWHVFYQCYRMYPGQPDQHNPLDNDLALACVEDMILRYRNNPSIIAWVGAVEVVFDEELYHPTRDLVFSLDRTRPYIPTTSCGWNVDELTPYLKDAMPFGTTDEGAPDYNWAPSDYYFDKVNEVYLQMFRNELGMPSVPTYESLKKFIPTIDKEYDRFDPVYPLDRIWAHHGAWDVENYCYRSYDNAIRTLYNDPVSGADYARKGNIVSAEGYRAMYEAANHRLWDITSGVMLWKLNSCWPDVCWQIYDWYLSQNASYYFAKKAMNPVHVQMNANTNRLCIVNASHKPLGKVKVRARMVDASMKSRWEKEEAFSVGEDCFVETDWAIPHGGRMSAVYFIRLDLIDKDGNVLDENLYWRYSQHQNYSWLVNQPKVDLNPQMTVKEAGKEYDITVTLTNDSQNVSFFNHMMIRRSDTGEVVNPVFWEDNFITLFPGESKTIHAFVAKEDMMGEVPVLDIE